MKRILSLLLIVAVILSFAITAVTEQIEIAAVYTTDEHGRIYDWDYFKDKEADVGLVRCATILEGLKAKHPNMILFSCGDTIQGTPLTYYHARFDNEPIDPMMLSLNYMGYEAFVVANHEFNYGLDVLCKAQAEAEFPFLAANCVDENGEPFFGTPYIIKEFEGVKVGLLGFCTPGVPNWELPENYAGITFVDIVESAKYWVPLLRDEVDLLLVSMHSGAGSLEGPRSSYEAGIDNPPENVGFQLAKEVPGIDVIFLGHSHTIKN